jgi:putative peptidoglycan lipid II flippase
MGALLWLTAAFVLAPAAGAHGLGQAVLLIAVIAGGIAIYGLFLALFGVIRWTKAVNAVRRTKASDLRQ